MLIFSSSRYLINRKKEHITMGKNYYCEFCQRGFSDILSTRKKHIKSAQHQKLRKLHYDSFKDPITILEEESSKNLCKRFFEYGHCNYQDNCKYSHQDMTKLRIAAEQSKVKHTTNLNTVHKWIENWKKEKGDKNVSEYQLPLGFPPFDQLPPSLQPPLLDENNTLEDVEWG